MFRKKICWCCGKTFRAFDSRKRYCSKECAKENNRQMSFINRLENDRRNYTFKLTTSEKNCIMDLIKQMRKNKNNNQK